MTTDREPFGDVLFDGINDFSSFLRETIVAARNGIDVRTHRAATAARPVTYTGGPVCWEAPRMAEAA